MNHVVINVDYSAMVRAAHGPLEMRDESGKLLGLFVPNASPPAPPCPYDEHQLAEMRSESGGRSLHDIWKSAGSSL